MTALQIIIIVAIAAVLLGMGVCLGWVFCSRRFSDQIAHALDTLVEGPDPKVAINAAIERLIATTRGPSRMRFEISVDDWGPEHGEMRWRWTIWDAERIFLAVVEPTSVPASIGVEVPVMLGNAPTKMKALDDAMHWVMSEGGTIVVVPSVLAAEAQDEHVYDIRHFTGPGRPTTLVDGVEVSPGSLEVIIDIDSGSKVLLCGREVKAKFYRDQMLYVDTSTAPLMKVVDLRPGPKP